MNCLRYTFRSLLLAGLLQLLPFLSSSQTVIHAEVLGRPTDSSIIIQMIFQDSVEVAIEYGMISGTYTNQTTWQLFPDSITAEIELNNLQPDTRYYYRTLLRSPRATSVLTRPEFTFHTKRQQGQTFTFDVIADVHVDEQTDTAILNRCMLNQTEDQPDFIVDLGDFLMSDKLKDTVTNRVPLDTITYRCHLLRNIYEQTCHSSPLFIAIGNHEGESGWLHNGTASNIPVRGSQERKRFFPNPYPNSFYSGDTTNYPFIGQRGSYYSWQWGDALFIVLDPYWYTTVKPDSLHGWRWTLGENQYLWLKSVLENSNATFKFVFAHHLIGGDPEGRGGTEFADLYEWGGNNLDSTNGFATNRPGWYKPIKDLLTENKVTVFFHGHDHFFGKQEKDCLIYQECPQPGHPNYNNAGQAATYGYLNGQILPNSGHMRVTVSPQNVLIEYVRAYKAADENGTRHNKDVSAFYSIGNTNCYDSTSTTIPMIWNSNYAEEIVYPNPFNKDTRIKIQTNKDDLINLSIYSANGAKVRTLLNDQLIKKGNFDVVWDGTNDLGQLLPDGIYSYSIYFNQSNQRTTGNIVLIK